MPITLIIESLALLLGLLFWKRIRQNQTIPLFWLLAAVVVAESIGAYLRRVLHVPNVQVYNVITAIEFLVYAWYFKKNSQDKWVIQMGNAFLWSYPLCWSINMIWGQGFQVFHTYTMILGSLFMVALGCRYLYSLFLEEEERDLFSDPLFWISAGTLFFYAGDLINSYLLNATYKVKILPNLSLFKLINNSLNFILYLSYVLAFQCSKINTK